MKNAPLAFNHILISMFCVFFVSPIHAEVESEDSLEALIQQQAIMLKEIRLQKENLGEYLEQQELVKPMPQVHSEPSQENNQEVLQFQLQVVSKQLVDLKERNKELEEQLSTAIKAGQSVEQGESADGQKFSDRLNLLRVQLDEVKSMMRQRESLVANLKSQNEGLSSENLSLKSEVEQLKADQDALFKANLEITGLKEQHEKISEELRLAKAERDESEMNAAIMAQKLVEVESATEKVVHALKSSAEKDQVVLQMKIASLEGMVKASDARFTERESKFQGFVNDRQQLSRELSDEKSRNRELVGRVRSLETELSKVRDHMETKISQRNKALEDQVSKMESRFDSLKQSAADDQEKNYADQKAYIHELELRVRELSKLSENQDQHLQTILEDRHQINRKLIEKEQKYDELRKSLTDIVQNRQQIERAVEQKILEARLPLESEIKTLKTKLKETEDLYATARESTDTSSEFLKVNGQVQQLQAELDQKIIALNNLETEKALLQEELSALKGENVRLSQQTDSEKVEEVQLMPVAEPIASKESKSVSKELKAAEERNEDLQQEITLLKAQIKDLMEGSRVPLMEEIALLERKLKKLEREKKELIGSDGDVVDISARLEEYDARILELENEKEDLIEQNAQLTKELEQFKTQTTIEPLSGGEFLEKVPADFSMPAFSEIRPN